MLEMFFPKKELIDVNAVNQLAGTYPGKIVYFCGFVFLKNGRIYAPKGNRHKQSLLVLDEQSIIVHSIDQSKYSFAYGEFIALSEDICEIVFSSGSDVFECFSFLTLQELNQQTALDTKNIDALSSNFQSNLQTIVSVLVQKGATQMHV